MVTYIETARAAATMRIAARFFAAILAIAVFSSNAGATAAPLLKRNTPVPSDQPIPSSDFVRPVLFSDPVLNPSGTYFAASIANQHFAENILVCEIATGKFEWSDVKSDVLSFIWLNDKELCVITAGGYEHKTFGLYSVGALVTVREVGDLDTVKEAVRIDRKLHRKYGAIEGTSGILVEPAPAPMHGWPDGYLYGYFARPEDGNLDFCMMVDRGILSLYRYDGEKLIKSPINPVDIYPIAIGSRPGEMIAYGPRTEGKPRAIQYVDIDSGKLGKVLYQDEKYDSVGVIVRRPGNWDVLGLSVPLDASRAVWFDPKRQHVQDMLNHFFPHSRGAIVSADRTDSRFLVQEISDVKPPTYYVLDLGKRSIGLLKNVAPWIDPSRMRPMQSVSYRARDGAIIEGFLTLPSGASKERRVPLVVLPHYGPWDCDRWGWRPDVQFLASRGYAVFMPNYRGSDGYDWRFAPDDRWDFAKMHADVTDGTKAVLATGLIDPGRVAILGAGFGGYLALYGAVDEPDLYKCALTVGGIFDWKEAVDTYEFSEDPHLHLFRKYMEARPDPAAAYAAISPIKRIKNLRIPVFIANNIKGRNNPDLAMMRPQTIELSHAIPRDVPEVVYGDLHLTSVEDAFEDAVGRMNAIEAFLAKYLGPAPASAPR